MKREYFLVWVILIFSHTVAAQDQTNFTQFFLNPYLVNPSYVGIDGKSSIVFTYRKQWVDIEGGPQIANATFHTPISRRVSFGLSATDDQKGLLQNSGLMLSFGYNIPLSQLSFIRFGISGGISSNSVDLKRLDGFEDQALAKLLDNNMSVLGNAGISFHLNTFHAGFSLPVIFEPAYISREPFSITEINPFQTAIFHFSNRFYFANDRHIFEPYVLYRMATNLPPQFEVAGVVHLNHAIWFGGSFKQDFGISALGGIKLNQVLAIGGAYSLKNSGDNELNSPTYEVSLGLLIGKRKKDRPVYSFVSTEKEKIKKGTGKSASEQIAEKRRQQELARKNALDAEAKRKREEELARKQAEVDALRQKEAERRKQEEERRRQEALAKQNAQQNTQQQPVQPTQPQPQRQQQPDNSAAEAAKRQKEEQERLQREEAARRQREEQERLQREEAARLQREEAARLQREEAARLEREEAARREREAAARRAREEEERRRQEEARRRAAEEEAQRLVQQQQQPQEPETFNTTTRTDTVVLKHKPRFSHVDAAMEVVNIEVTEHNAEDEKERLSRLQTHAANPTEVNTDASSPNAERHEFMEKGTNRKELDAADYVAAGVFADESNARLFVDGLKKLGFKAGYGFVSEKGVWYVYLYKGNDINEARKQRDRFRKMKIFRDAWLVSVQY